MLGDDSESFSDGPSSRCGSAPFLLFTYGRVEMPTKKKRKRHIRLHYVTAGTDHRWYAQVRVSRTERAMLHVTGFYLSSGDVIWNLQASPRIRW